MPLPSLTEEQSQMFLLGSIIGNALGLPANGKPHHILRQFFKGIKGYTDEYFTTMSKTGLRKGQCSENPIPILKSIKLPLIEIEMSKYLSEFLKISSENAIKVSRVCLHYAQNESKMEAKAQAFEEFGVNFINRFEKSQGFFPIDLVNEFDGGMSEKNALELTLAFFLRNETDFETFLLSTINMGGFTSISGAIAGGIGLIGRKIEEIPKDWIKDLENSEEILNLIGLK